MADDSKFTTRRRVSVEEGLQRIPDERGRRFAELFRHGTLSIEIYAPRGHDPQTPHTRDEAYIVVCGHGWFVNESRRERFGPGDLLFAAAGEIHRFEDFTDDLVVWVLFYGPEGGERRAARGTA